MVNQQIALVYFSATNVTQRYIEVIQEHLVSLSCTVETFNVTSYGSRQKQLSFSRFDGVIFGFPVFTEFAPRVINDWLPTLEGRRKPCATFFTYGGRTTGYAHFHTKLLLDEAGFQVLCSAEFLGRHSFNLGGWSLAPERPDAVDFDLARDYAALAAKRFLEDAPATLRLQKPFGYDQVMAAIKSKPPLTKHWWRNPLRNASECSMCRLCESECPAQAFNADTGLSDPGTCMGCMHCVHICPDEVIKADKMLDAYGPFLSSWHLAEDIAAGKRSRIITEPWETHS